MSHTLPLPHAHAGEYLSFRLGPEEYGIPILTVQEIRGYQEPTRIANAPAFMKGVVNLRGVIVPIVDLRTRFGQSATCNEVTATIVLNIGRRVIGIVVDSVSDVVALAAGQIKPPPRMPSSGVDAAYVTGIATEAPGEAARMLILVDIEQLMSSDDLGLVEAVHEVREAECA
ncbi:chemotaxis protein CheW [Hydrogenophaga sp. OTU3427]|uniref:chemotaxis protein CheW n=1 Tax=Hydrogenophaga sp. OTU3427 TaxID=3043856 RepID=UPI00313AFA29